MLTSPKRFTVPPLFAVLAVAAGLVACGGSGDSSGSDLAGYIPADAPVYIEGMVRPEGDVAANADAIAEKLTGSTLSDAISEATSSSDKSDIDFEQDVEPWLGESAGVYIGSGFLGDLSATDIGSAAMSAAADPGSGAAVTAAAGDSEFGLIAEITDTDGAELFLKKLADEEGGATEGDYEGSEYRVSEKDDFVTGIVDGNLVGAGSLPGFKAMVDATKADSLKDSDAYADIAGKVDDASLVNVYIANDAFAATAGEDGPDPNAVLKSLGLDVNGTGSIISLVPEKNEISIRAVSDTDSDLEGADPSKLLETFPADSVLALGSGDAGANAKKILDGLNQDGIEGLLPPGELDRQLNQLAAQGLDLKSLIEDLEAVGLFVSGNSIQNVGGALVATSADIGPFKQALNAFSSLLALGGDQNMKKLGGGLTGFQVTGQIPGRPVVVAVGDDRLVIAIGMPAARQALKGQGSALSDSPAFKAAEDSIPGDGINLFGDPSALADLVASGGATDAGTEELADALGKFRYMAAGPGESDGSFELNLGLKE